MSLFGTDGVRDIFGEGFLTKDSITTFIHALIKIAKEYGVEGFVIGRDTRVSGLSIEQQLQEHLSTQGINVYIAGIVPTALVSLACRRFEIEKWGHDKKVWGIVISASHNPYTYNGLKIFQHQGYKLSESVEQTIEEIYDSSINNTKHPKNTKNSPHPTEWCPTHQHGKVQTVDLRSMYFQYIKKQLGIVSLNNMRIALDCANGAAVSVAPDIFENYQAVCKVMAHTINFLDSPQLVSSEDDHTSHHINDGVGATYPSYIQGVMQQGDFDVGFTFDGDADRVLVVHPNGHVLDGDMVIALLAHKYLDNAKKHGVVGTYITSLGLEEYLKSLGVTLHRTKIGDKYIFQKMQETGSLLGGEYSGHIICADILPIGDGVINALQIANLLNNNPNILSNIIQDVPSYYTVNESIPKKSMILMDWDAIQKIVDHLKKHDGLMVVRPSGTEPIIRIWATGKNDSMVDDAVHDVKKLLIS